ncbi:hypothetical protein ACQKJG_23330 [Priestia megaterium]|uniref:hypothetical protein n=1 Tax=Priestia TaxID=2800373 RepID=UPI001C8DAC81|nr:hypothetical protein [Priestia aryabhattai]
MEKTILVADDDRLVSSLVGVAKTDSTDLGELSSELFHPVVGLLVLLVIVVLSMYKPRGMTRYGWRKQQEQHNVLKQ